MEDGHDPADAARPSLSPRRLRTRKARFAEIRTTAMALIAEAGLEQLTMHRLAAALDCVPGTLYRYYPSKDALMLDLYRGIIAELSQWLRERLDKKRETWRDQPAARRTLALLLSLPRFYAEYGRAYPPQFRLLSLSLCDPEPVLTDGEARQIVAALINTLTEIGRLFADGEAAGAIGPGDNLQRAQMLWLTAHIVAATRKLSRASNAINPDATLLDMTLNQLRGWQASDAALRDAVALLDAPGSGRRIAQ